MSDRFFYLIEGVEHGPVSLRDMYQLLESGKLRDESQIREPGGSWQTVAEFACRLSENSESVAEAGADSVLGSEYDSARPFAKLEMQRLFAECVKRQVRHAPKKLTKGRNPSRRWRGASLAGVLRSIGSSLAELAGSITEIGIAILAKAARSRLVWLSSGLIVLAVVMNQKVPVQWISLRRIHTELKQIIVEMKELRASQADEATWDAFEQRARARLAEFVPRLNKATSENQIAPPLLTIDRYLLPSLVADREGRDTVTEKRIDEMLQEVDRAFQKVDQQPTDLTGMTYTAFITFDIIAVIAAAIYFGRGWWLGNFATR